MNCSDQFNDNIHVLFGIGRGNASGRCMGLCGFALPRRDLRSGALSIKYMIYIHKTQISIEVSVCDRCDENAQFQEKIHVIYA